MEGTAIEATPGDEGPLSSYLPGIMLKTRNARAEAERRLLAYDMALRQANMWCSCLTVTLAILSVFSHSDALAFASAASAAILAIGVFYASSRNYADQAARMRACYTELQGLTFEASLLLSEGGADVETRMADLGRRYVEVLKRTDNHTSGDHLRAVAGNRNKRSSDQESGAKRLRLRQARFYLLMVAAYVLPVILIVVLSLVFCAVQAVQ